MNVRDFPPTLSLPKTDPPAQSPPLRLTFVTHEYLPTRGGAATVVDELARAAHAEGWPAKILAPGKGSISEDRQVPVIRMGHRGKQDLFARRALLRFLGAYERKADEHLVFSDPGATRAALYGPEELLAHPGGYSLVLHGSEIPLFAKQGRAFRKLLRGAFRIHLLSEANRKLLVGRNPEIEPSIRVAPGAPSSWTRKGIAPNSQKKTDLLTILTVGRIHPRKGQKETLLALSDLPASLKEKIRYRIVGPTVRKSYLRQIEKLVPTCGFPVEFSGVLSEKDLSQAYSSADIFALNSQPKDKSVEGFGLVYLDASAFGLPIVANRIGGVAEAVPDQRTGLLVDPGTPRELTSAFRDLLDNETLRVSLGRQAEAWAKAHDWSRTLFKVWAE